MSRKTLAAKARRLIVKVGSAIVTRGGQGVDRPLLESFARQFAALKAQGREIVLVTSGAIAEGVRALGLSVRPRNMDGLQAAAAAGQMRLMSIYESAFALAGLRGAQILLTAADLADRERYLNARATLLALLEIGAVPIINENDTVATEEIQFGDNDTLAALTANLIDADLLILLTDQEGLFTADPRLDAQAQLVREGQAGDAALEAMAGGSGSAIARGGMRSKLLAARRAAAGGAGTLIAPGRQPDVLLRLLAGEELGTLLKATTKKSAARKQWMADHLHLSGSVVIDAGAASKLREAGKSLLPIGVRVVQGEFARGDVIAVLGMQGEEIARGLAQYSSAEARRIVGKASAEIETLLGYRHGDELIHRNDLVLMQMG